MTSIGNTVFFSIKALYKRIIDIENKLSNIIPATEMLDINKELSNINISIDEQYEKHKDLVNSIEDDLGSMSLKLNNVDTNISRIDLTFDNVNKDFKLLESLQNEQQTSLVELANNIERLSNSMETIKEQQYLDKLEMISKMDDLKKLLKADK